MTPPNRMRKTPSMPKIVFNTDRSSLQASGPEYVAVAVQASESYEVNLIGATSV